MVNGAQPHIMYIITILELTARDFQQSLDDVNSAESHCVVERSKTISIQSIDLDLALVPKPQKVI